MSYSNSAHAGQIGDCGGTAENEHGRHDDIRRESGIRSKSF